jgi:2-polyprenyl-3-methyl-5-hydroxy-6-metoxy-1,4-benzoquinol methylase
MTDQREIAADWDSQWQREPLNLKAPAEEKATLRWRAQEQLVREHFSGFDGLRAIEIGAGRGLNALLYAQAGAHVTLLDLSETALEQAAQLFRANGVAAEFVQGDLFALPDEMVGAFDVSMSFGLCEHFLGERRLAVIRAHLDLLRSGGVAMLGVPNRWGVVYQLWMKTLKARGTWELGTEVPFTPAELATLVEAAGGRPLAPQFGSFVGSVVNHGLNQALFKLGRGGLPVPQLRVPGVDRLAYELLVPAVKP